MTIGEFTSGQPAGAPPLQLEARWSVEGAEGALAHVVTDLDADLALTVEAPDGNYAINWAAVADSEAQSIRRGAIVPLFRPTATPTPTPTPNAASASRCGGAQQVQLQRRRPAARQHQHRDWRARQQLWQRPRDPGDAVGWHDLDENPVALLPA